MATADHSSTSTVSQSQEETQRATAVPSAQPVEDSSHRAHPQKPPSRAEQHPNDTGASSLVSVTQDQNISHVQNHVSDSDNGEKGQAPSSLQVTPIPSTGDPAKTAKIAKTSTVTLSDSELSNGDKEKGSSLAAFTLPIISRKGNRRREQQSASEGMYTASSTTERASSPATGETKSISKKKTKAHLFSWITHMFTSCVTPSHRTHVVDVDEGPSHGTDQKDLEKNLAKDEQMTERPSWEPSSSSAVISAPPPLIIPTPPAIADTEVVVPPTPTRQLLPLEETDGLTSGAVQPPGSTGEETKEHVHVVVADSGDESDGSYSDDDMFAIGLRVDDLEDEEQKLIKQGGVGIPIGADGKLQPLLPPISPRHAGRKCLVLDLDETLVHSSLRPVSSPDYIVPVEIESNWHNFYVLKRPGVDNFLRKMGELYEVVVFTASLSKYADPVLDRLDPDRTVAHRLFRESCYNHRGNYVKDLSQLGRPMGDTIILDNSPASYIFHPHNAVPVSSWFSDAHDTELGDMCPFLADLSIISNDVRGILNPTV